MINAGSRVDLGEAAHGSVGIESAVTKERSAGTARLGLHADRLLQLVAPYRRIWIVTHDHPDPDAIATGWAMRLLFETRTRASVRFVAGGRVTRAENKQLVRLLKPPLELVTELTIPDDTAVVMVDCAPQSSHHLLVDSGVTPLAVIDHHELTGALPGVPFADVRPALAASVTMAADYLWQSQIEPSARLATAMVYALRTETRGHETRFSPLDCRMLRWLNCQANPQTLAEIESAPLTTEYFAELASALQATQINDDAAFCVLPRVSGAEMIGEVADLLIRNEALTKVFCGAVVDGDFVVSVRTSREGGQAPTLVRQTLAGLGHGGGHDHRAGGKVPGLCLSDELPMEILEDIRHRWWTVCGRPEVTMSSLVERPTRPAAAIVLE